MPSAAPPAEAVDLAGSIASAAVPSGDSALRQAGWNLVAGTLTRYVLLFVNIAIGVFLMPFTIHHLGKAQYGLWMLAASMTSYLQLLDLGYGNGIVRQVTQADARGDEHEMNVILSTFVVIYSLIGIAALAAVSFLVAFVLPRFPNISTGDVRTAQWVLAILGLRIAIAFPFGVFGAVTTARQRFALTGWIAVAVAVLQGIATYVVLLAGYGLIALVGVSTLIGVASYVAYAGAARATFPGMRLSPSRFSRRQVREVTAFSLYLFLISIAIHVGLNIDNVIIGAYLGTSAIAVYTVAVRLSDYQRQLCGQFCGLLFPLVVRFEAGRDVVALRTTLLDGSRIALGLVGGVTLCLVAFARPIVDRWMGGGFGESIAPLYILVVAGVVMVAQGPAGTILLANGRHRLVAAASILEIGFNIVLSVALVSHYGLMGVALGTALPYAVLNIAVLIPIACRTLDVPLRRFADVVITPCVVALLPATALAMLLRSTTTPGSLIVVFAQSAIVAAVYVAAFFAFGLPAAERAGYANSMRRGALDQTSRAFRAFVGG
jgi:O-antigen/teichoic acid export membrane protein